MTVPDATLSDREWIAANPTRFWRIVRQGEPDRNGLVLASILEIDADRRSWTTQNLMMRAELPDSDEAARKATGEYPVIVTSRGGLDAVLAKMRAGTGAVIPLRPRQ